MEKNLKLLIKFIDEDRWDDVEKVCNIIQENGTKKDILKMNTILVLSNIR